MLVYISKIYGVNLNQRHTHLKSKTIFYSEDFVFNKGAAHPRISKMNLNELK